MEIYIFTKRFEAYSKLFSLFYGESVSFRGTEDHGVFRKDGMFGLPRIVLADPKMLENQLPGNDQGASGIFFLVGAPDHVNGIAMEIRTLLKEQGGSEIIFPQERSESEHVYRPIMKPKPIQEKPVRAVIGIAGMGKGAGASFLTLLLAEELAAGSSLNTRQITVFSTDDPDIYNALGMQKRFDETEFMDVAVMKNMGAVISPNLDEGISWAVAAPGSESLDMLPAEKASIIQMLPGNYILWDMGCRELAMDLRQARGLADVLIFVIDPLPSKLIKGTAAFEKVKNSGIPVIWLINKWNEGVDRAAVLDFLEIKEPVIMPLMEQALIYRAEFACENPYRERMVRDEAADSLGELVRKIEDVIRDR